MKRIQLMGTLRKETGKIASKKQRRVGFVPAALYGKNVDSIHLLVPKNEIEKIMIGHARMNAIFELSVEGNGKDGAQLAMVQKVQKDTFHKNIIHIDFYKISLDQKIKVSVPIRLKGSPVGLVKGGSLDHVLWEIEIKTLPEGIPEVVEANVDHLDLGDSLTVKELILPEGAEATADKDEVVAIVHAPRTVAEEEAVPVAGATKEPEVLEKGKKEEEK